MYRISVYIGPLIEQSKSYKYKVILFMKILHLKNTKSKLSKLFSNRKV